MLGRAIFDLSVVFCRLFSLGSFPLSSFLTKCFSPEANWVRKIGLNAISFFFFVYSLIPLCFISFSSSNDGKSQVFLHTISQDFFEKRRVLSEMFLKNEIIPEIKEEMSQRGSRKNTHRTFWLLSLFRWSLYYGKECKDQLFSILSSLPFPLPLYSTSFTWTLADSAKFNSVLK